MFLKLQKFKNKYNSAKGHITCGNSVFSDLSNTEKNLAYSTRTFVILEDISLHFLLNIKVVEEAIDFMIDLDVCQAIDGIDKYSSATD